MHFVTCDDANGHTFQGLTTNPHPEPEVHVPVFIFIVGENGWSANHGSVSMQMLKKRADGHFVS